MGIKYKSRSSEPHAGYGAGSGSIDTTVYTCPCGAGEVTHVRDNIPGFKSTDIMIDCDVCRSKYGMVESLSELD